MLSYKQSEKEDDMWFVIVVLLISFILNINSRENENDTAEQDVSNRVVHPAEYLLR